MNFPDTDEGFSKTNVKLHVFVCYFITLMVTFSQALPDQLTWTHNIVYSSNLMEPENINVDNGMQMQTIDNRWYYREFQTQIQSNLYNQTVK